MSLAQGDFSHTSFVLLNALFFAYTLRMIGVREAFGDLFLNRRRRRAFPPRPAPRSTAMEAETGV